MLRKVLQLMVDVFYLPPQIELRGASMNNIRILDYVIRQAIKKPDSPAIFAPDKSCITYKQLEAKVNKLSEYLVQNGFGKQRIAVVMPNGPEMVITFYAISNVAVFVPLNPVYSAEEFKNYMKLMRVDALMLQDGTYPSAKLAALDLAIPLILLHPSKTGAFSDFRISCEENSRPANQWQISRGNDIAVVLHTSGTTGSPRIVPLSHANLNSFIENAPCFDLTERDRCIHVTPLFHIGGIVGPVLSSAVIGGSLISIASFAPREFLRLIDELSPTWYAGSPAIHQAIIRYIESEGIMPLRYSLRYIRSSGAPLPVQLEEKLAKYFGGIVVKVYGLTETGGTGTFTPPMSGKNKKNSVGIAGGCEVGIMDDGGSFLPPGKAGAIFIKGPGVTKGYENNDFANARSFRNGWFATGDQGYFDEDGCLFITGRTKEIINRGGVKISPYEVENILSQHSDVLETAVFAVPHPVFGEAPAAMVVLKPGTNAMPRQLKLFLRDKIAQYKIPEQIIIVDKIPRGATGKVQRSKLYEHVAETIQSNPQWNDCRTTDFLPPGTEMEKMVADIWRKLLKIEEIGVQDDFVELGGDSLAAAVLFAEIEQVLGKKLSINTILEYRTIEQLASLLENEANSQALQSLVTIKAEGTRSPLFCIHAVDGDVLSYRKLATYLGNDQPVYGFWFNKFAEGLRHPVEISDLASCYIGEMRALQPTGPYFIVGHSMGGLIAYEMARQLRSQNQQVALLAMLDTWLIHKRDRKKLAEKVNKSWKKSSSVSVTQTPHYLFAKIAKEIGRFRQKLLARKYRMNFINNAELNELRTPTILKSALRKYRPGSYDGTIMYFKSEEDPDGYSSEAVVEWSKLANHIQTVQIAGDHGSMIIEPHVKELADKVRYAVQTAAHQADRVCMK